VHPPDRIAIRLRAAPARLLQEQRLTLLRQRNEAAASALQQQQEAQQLQRLLETVEGEARSAKGWLWGPTAIEVQHLLGQHATADGKARPGCSEPPAVAAGKPQ
jgi:hypothetical protein